jgi:hypothetical protein
MKTFAHRLICAIYLHYGVKLEARKRYSAAECPGCCDLLVARTNVTPSCPVCGRPRAESIRETYFIWQKHGR